ncbi:MAG TPA: FAD-dependent oxidoreductase, partial [Acidimicrobiales bacterium]|nr:FAD-dependent oxidoreductase [Acidimicrobiales bacterium]
MAEQFDVVIVGGGPGGYASALYAAAAGLSVALVERDRVGGTCLHRGCIPAKELLETASVRRTIAGAAAFGLDAGEPTIDFGITMKRKQKVIDGLWKGLQGLLKRRKVTTFAGTGTLGADGRVTVQVADGPDQELRGDSVILAAGSLPRTIPGFDLDGRFILTSDELLSMTELPASAAVVGGGAIGCEFASMLADLGVQVSLLESLPKLLPGCDGDVAAVVRKSFEKRGIDVRTGVQVEGHDPGESTTTVRLGDGASLEVERVVVSVG